MLTARFGWACLFASQKRKAKTMSLLGEICIKLVGVDNN